MHQCLGLFDDFILTSLLSKLTGVGLAFQSGTVELGRV